VVDLCSNDDLAAYLQRDVVAASANTARRVATGWLHAETGLASWPNPVPEELWAWAVELSALAYSNPEGLSTESVDDGGYTAAWSRGRKAEILAMARRRYAGTGHPSGSFPAAVGWPDPIRCAR
jgi:hypothetical protein